MRPENREDDQETILAKASRANVDKSKERIDTEKYAQAAIDKARNTLELRQFLDERKTDWDKMEDMKRKLDADMQDLDQDLADRNADFENRKSKWKMHACGRCTDEWSCWMAGWLDGRLRLECQANGRLDYVYLERRKQKKERKANCNVV